MLLLLIYIKNVCIGTMLSAGIGVEPSSGFKETVSWLRVGYFCFQVRGFMFLIFVRAFSLETYE